MSTSRKKTLPGFTLIEMVISLGIFSIIAVAVAGTFASGFSTYKETRALSRNLESAQFAMNTLAKLLRTSTVDPGSPSSSNQIIFYDHSSSRCFQYRIWSSAVGSSVLQARWFPLTDSSLCRSSTNATFPPTFSQVTSGFVTGGFLITPSMNPTRAGRVTLSLSVKTNASAVREAHVQTTTSLRDYKEIGF